MVWKPKKWRAVVLGLVAPPLAMLYLARARWALPYFLVGIALALLNAFFVLDRTIHPWLRYDSFTFILNVACAIHAFKIVSHDPSIARRPWYSWWYGMGSIVPKANFVTP